MSERFSGLISPSSVMYLLTAALSVTRSSKQEISKCAEQIAAKKAVSGLNSRKC